MNDDVRTLSAAQIMELLPHRYPFLLIDKVIDYVPNKSVTAVKNVSINEPFFQGHFPGNPVMPGVLIIEAMAQAGGVLSHVSNPDLEPRPLYYLVGVDGARFRRAVGPGDRLRVQVEVDKVRRGMWWYRCEASVEGHPVVTAKILCAPGGDGS
jgi:3-hydroxyacyl-[acyl-carrier-protein] dehydratase